MRESLKEFKNRVGTKVVSMLEIGVCSGKNAEIIFNNFRLSTLYLLDWWQAKYSKERDKWVIDTFKAFEESRTVIIIRAESLDAAHLFKDLDYIYLDDNHNPEHVFLEMEMYWMALKPGGMLAGHDYDTRLPGRVIEALNRFADKYKVTIRHRMNEGERVGDWWIWK